MGLIVFLTGAVGLAFVASAELTVMEGILSTAACASAIFLGAAVIVYDISRRLSDG